VSKTERPAGRDTRWLNSLVQQIDVVCQLVTLPGGVVRETDVTFPAETMPDRASQLALRSALDELARRYRLRLSVTCKADGILVTINVPPQPAPEAESAVNDQAGLRRFFGWIKRHDQSK